MATHNKGYDLQGSTYEPGNSWCYEAADATELAAKLEAAINEPGQPQTGLPDVPPTATVAVMYEWEPMGVIGITFYDADYQPLMSDLWSSL